MINLMLKPVSDTAAENLLFFVKKLAAQEMVILIPVSKSIIRKLLWFIDSRFWFTYRLPFQKLARITYPDSVVDPKNNKTFNHELVHVIQFQKWHAPFMIPLLAVLFPLPILFSGRWFIERKAYLYDIKVYEIMSVDQAVDILWEHYFYCWPKPLMKKWFIKEMAKLPECK